MVLKHNVLATNPTTLSEKTAMVRYMFSGLLLNGTF
jgi:hypothetical protein